MQHHLDRRGVDTLLQKYAPDDGFVSDYESLLVKEGTNWYLDWYPDMARMDAQIPGVGLHWLRWTGDGSDSIPRTGWYPHAHSRGYGDWDLIIRALRYFAMGFWNACPAQHTMNMTYSSIQSVEECLKKVGVAAGLNVHHQPMGTLCNTLAGVVRKDVCDDIKELNHWLIMLKHASETPLERRRKEHRIDLDESTGIYYVSRLLGATVLGSREELVGEYVGFAEDAFSHGRNLQVTYQSPSTSLTPWSIIKPNPTYNSGSCLEPSEIAAGESIWM